MGPTDRRLREKEATRARILSAARELFVRDGVAAVTMRKIAQRIEYTPTAIYHHFADKDTLLRELCEHDFRALATAFLRIGRIEDPVERVAAIGRAYMRFGREHPEQYRFMFMTDRPEVSKTDTSIERGNPEEDAYEALHSAVREAIAAGRFKPMYADADLVSQVLMSAVHGAVAMEITFAEDDWIEWRDGDVLGEAVIRVTLDGLLAVPRP